MGIQRYGLTIRLSISFWLFALTSPLANSLTIDTTTEWSGDLTQAIHWLGEPDTAYYGQTFTISNTSQFLTDFTFYLDDQDWSATGGQPKGSVNFDARIYAWDGSQPTGSTLYRSDMRSTQNVSGMESFTFNANLGLTANSQYIAILYAGSDYWDGLDGLAYVGALNSNPYSGGKFVYRNNSRAWLSNDFNEHDLAFAMNFTSVPLPTAAWLFITALIGLSGIKCSRKINPNTHPKTH